ncbi:hypothetical protein J6E39_09840 [bacterium]|nr:hypothetical protein [bacterium]
MSNDYFEEQMIKKTTIIMDSIEDDLQYMIDAICETWARLHIIRYFKLMQEQYREKQKSNNEIEK